MDRHQLGQLSPPDAQVALRSYARRFPALFGPTELAAGELPLRQAVWRGWSVNGRLGAIARSVEALDAALAEVAVRERPELPADLLTSPAPTSEGPDAAATLARLAGSLLAAADRVAATPLQAWARPCTVGGTGSDAHELLRQLVAEGRTALDELAVVIDAARRSAR